jgi:hypothetical protein
MTLGRTPSVLYCFYLIPVLLTKKWELTLLFIHTIKHVVVTFRLIAKSFS